MDRRRDRDRWERGRHPQDDDDDGRWVMDEDGSWVWSGRGPARGRSPWDEEQEKRHEEEHYYEDYPEDYGTPRSHQLGYYSQQQRSVIPFCPRSPLNIDIDSPGTGKVTSPWT